MRTPPTHGGAYAKRRGVLKASCAVQCSRITNFTQGADARDGIRMICRISKGHLLNRPVAHYFYNLHKKDTYLKREISVKSMQFL